MFKKALWESSKLKWLRWICLLSILGYFACFASLLIRPERFGFVIAVILSVIAILLFVYDFIQVKVVESMIQTALQVDNLTVEQTVFNFEFDGGTLVSVELYDGHITKPSLVGKRAGVSVYEVAGNFCIIHEFSDIPFTIKNIVRVFKKA